MLSPKTANRLFSAVSPEADNSQHDDYEGISSRHENDSSGTFTEVTIGSPTKEGDMGARPSSAADKKTSITGPSNRVYMVFNKEEAASFFEEPFSLVIRGDRPLPTVDDLIKDISNIFSEIMNFEESKQLVDSFKNWLRSGMGLEENAFRNKETLYNALSSCVRGIESLYADTSSVEVKKEPFDVKKISDSALIGEPSFSVPLGDGEPEEDSLEGLYGS